MRISDWSSYVCSSDLLDLAFLEDNVLPHHRIVFPELQLFRLGARIFLGHVVVARIGSADELDQEGVRLGHREIRSEQCAVAWGGKYNSTLVSQAYSGPIRDRRYR